MLGQPFEEMILGLVTKLKCAIGRIVWVLVLVSREVFWECKETGTAKIKPGRLISSLLILRLNLGGTNIVG